MRLRQAKGGLGVTECSSKPRHIQPRRPGVDMSEEENNGTDCLGLFRHTERILHSGKVTSCAAVVRRGRGAAVFGATRGVDTVESHIAVQDLTDTVGTPIYRRASPRREPRIDFPRTVEECHSMRTAIFAAILVLSTPAAGLALDVHPQQVLENGLTPPIAARGRASVRRPLVQRMRELKVPGVSIAFVRNFQIEWAQGYGMADLAGEYPVTTETRFQAASISKCVAAVAALRLVERGALQLDEDVNAKLKSWKVPDNPLTLDERVTLRRLLSHAAGLSVSGFPGYPSGDSIPQLLNILDGGKPANNAAVRVECTPGMQYVYSGGGYEVLQQLLTDTTGDDFAEIVQADVFGRVHMKHSMFAQPLPSSYAADAATGYQGDGSPLPGRYYTYPELAAAGLWTTPSDIALLCIELMKARQGQTHRLLEPATAREMLSLQMKPSGLGFQLREGDAQWFLHTGTNAGFQSLLLFNFAGNGVVIMTNSDSGMILIHEIVSTLALAYKWTDFYPEQRPIATLLPERLQSYAGVYAAGRAGNIRVEVRDDQLEIGSDTRPAVSFFPESEDVFFPETPGFKARFLRDWFGRMMVITGPIRARRLTDVSEQHASAQLPSRHESVKPVYSGMARTAATPCAILHKYDEK